jgi:hypothetical protein
VTGGIFCAPPTWAADRAGPNVDAVAAAMIPRGAIHPMKPRSPLVRSVRSGAAEATSGRATDQRLEERPAGGDVKAAQVGRGEAHDDRGDQPGIVSQHVAGRGHADHTGQLGRGGADRWSQVIQATRPRARITRPG